MSGHCRESVFLDFPSSPPKRSLDSGNGQAGQLFRSRRVNLAHQGRWHWQLSYPINDPAKKDGLKRGGGIRARMRQENQHPETQDRQR